MTSATFLLFLGSSVALTLAPGPDITFVVTQGISRGRRAAIISALGMCSGVSVHTTAAALGISAVLYASSTAFSLLKFAGAAYLLYLAWKALKEPAGTRILAHKEASQPWNVLFRRGFLMNVVNPKVGLFFLAFLPHFVVPGEGNPASQMLLLGLIFMLQAVCVFSAVGYLSGGLGETLARRPAISRWFAWLSAGVFASLGLKLAFSQR